MGRKAGCVTLVMACVFVLAWIDSMTYFRSITVIDWTRSIAWKALSRDGKLTVAGDRFDETNMPTLSYYDGPAGTHVNWNGAPYWSIVIPLTLLSAYLLLSHPRVPAPKKASDPILVEAP